MNSRLTTYLMEEHLLYLPDTFEDTSGIEYLSLIRRAETELKKM